MGIKTMSDLFAHGLQDIYYAAQQIAKTLPEFAQKASTPSLSAHLNDHVEATRGQIRRLEEAFGALGQTPQGVTCQAILGLIEEGEEIVGETAGGPLRDAAIVASARAIASYEIKRYNSLIAWTGNPKVAELLQRSLAEETERDRRLAAFAEAR